jgi:hypothetical protein
MSFTAPEGAPPTNDKAAVQSGFEGLESRTTNNDKRTRKTTKLERMLHAFMNVDYLDYQRGGKIGDSCVNTTVSTLKRQHGIEFEITGHTVRGWNGSPTHCAKYALKRTPENLRRVRAFLGLTNEQSSEAATE